MSALIEKIDIDDSFLKDERIFRPGPDDRQGADILAGAINGWFKNLGASTTKDEVIIAGVDEDVFDRLYVGIVDKKLVASIQEQDSSTISVKDTLLEFAKGVVAFNLKESWDDDFQKTEREIGGHSASLEPVEQRGFITNHNLTVSIKDGQVLSAQNDRIAKSLDQIAAIKKDFDVGSWWEDSWKNEGRMELDSRLRSQISSTFGVGSLGARPALSQNKSEEVVFDMTG